MPRKSKTVPSPKSPKPEKKAERSKSKPPAPARTFADRVRRDIESPGLKREIAKYRKERDRGLERMNLTLAGSTNRDEFAVLLIDESIVLRPGTAEEFAIELAEFADGFLKRQAIGEAPAAPPMNWRDLSVVRDREISGSTEVGELARTRDLRMPVGRDRFRIALEIADAVSYDEGAFAVERFDIDARRGTIERAAAGLSKLIDELAGGAAPRSPIASSLVHDYKNESNAIRELREKELVPGTDLFEVAVNVVESLDGDGGAEGLTTVHVERLAGPRGTLERVCDNLARAIRSLDGAADREAEALFAKLGKHVTAAAEAAGSEVESPDDDHAGAASGDADDLTFVCMGNRPDGISLMQRETSASNFCGREAVQISVYIGDKPSEDGEQVSIGEVGDIAYSLSVFGKPGEALEKVCNRIADAFGLESPCEPEPEPTTVSPLDHLNTLDVGSVTDELVRQTADVEGGSK